jgi:hypothetical protein
MTLVSRRRWLFTAAILLLTPISHAATPADFTIGNEALGITAHGDGTFSVLDKRTGKTWEQQPARSMTSITEARKTDAGRIDLDLHDDKTHRSFHATLQLDGAKPEFTVTLSGTGALPAPLAYPHPFVGGENLIVPLNEGVRWPVHDPAIWPVRLVAYGGHGICMGFWGLTDGDAGQMAIFETADDGALRIDRAGKTLYGEAEWDSQKGQWGYDRRLRYIFLDHGGYVAMAKRYRAYAQNIGRFKTLAQKRDENPNVDQLVGAANVWCWEWDSPAMVKEMQQAGIDRILWSSSDPKWVSALNALGVLTSRYDLYQDVMDPSKFPQLQYVNPNWTTAAWPADLVLDSAGQWIHGWNIELKSGGMYPCGVLSDVRAVPYAQARISAELARTPYHCRFIDTTTAAAWREDYSPAHPMTRTQSRLAKMQLLDLVSGHFHLVTGSETGHDAAVPYVDYFEGMLSLTLYRLPDSGRRMQDLWTAPPPEPLTKFQLGPEYRLPLWELVYHDCVIAHWYWGDYNNKIPALWARRDLFNVLYGTAPMYMFDRKYWEQEKARFVQSYRTTCPVARATGYSEMVDHCLVTPDAQVQQSRFADGTVVTVNFGAAPYTSADGTAIPAGGYRVTGPSVQASGVPGPP